jgi:hypothetical protein
MGAIVFGQAHNQAGILIEPKAEYAIDVEDEDQLNKFRNLLWLVDLLALEHCLLIEHIFFAGRLLMKPIKWPLHSVGYLKK